MTCPSCSRSTRDYTNSSGLVTRCGDAWHARASVAHVYCPAYGSGGCTHAGECIGLICVAVRDTKAAHAAVNAPPAHPDPESASPATPENFVRPEPNAAVAPRTASWPFDPNPPKSIPAIDGFRWCHDCESVQPAAGHECAPVDAESVAWLRATVAEARADRAESLLCAMAFDHGRKDGWHNYTSAGTCAFCDAARGGGR